MTQDEFNDLSEDELIEGFKLSYENSSTLFEAAEELSSKNFTSLAISLIILSAEEALKTILFLIKINKTSPENEFDIQKLFSSHGYKHYILEDIFDIFLEPQKQIVETLQSFLNDLELKNKTIDTLKNAFNDNYKRRTSVLNSEDIISWWRNANDLKMRGFYLDYKNGEWISPKTLNREDYLRCFDIVGTILTSLTAIALMYDLDLNNK